MSSVLSHSCSWVLCNLRPSLELWFFLLHKPNAYFEMSSGHLSKPHAPQMCQPDCSQQKHNKEKRPRIIDNLTNVIKMHLGASHWAKLSLVVLISALNTTVQPAPYSWPQRSHLALIFLNPTSTCIGILDGAHLPPEHLQSSNSLHATACMVTQYLSYITSCFHWISSQMTASSWSRVKVLIALLPYSTSHTPMLQIPSSHQNDQFLCQKRTRAKQGFDKWQQHWLTESKADWSL